MGIEHKNAVKQSTEYINLSKFVRASDYERYLAVGFSSSSLRRELIYLIAFNKEILQIPDKVTESMIGRIRLQWWRESLFERKQVARTGNEILDGINFLRNKYDIGDDIFENIIKHAESDLEGFTPNSMSDVINHSTLSGGALNESIANILAPNLPKIAILANQYGTAWSLTKSMIDLPYLGIRAKSYLPLDHIHREGLTGKNIFDKVNSNKLSVIINSIINEAINFLPPTDGISNQDLNRAKPVFLLRTITLYYINKLRSNNYDPWELTLSSNRVNLLLKLGLASLFSKY